MCNEGTYLRHGLWGLWVLAACVFVKTQSHKSILRRSKAQALHEAPDSEINTRQAGRCLCSLWRVQGVGAPRALTLMLAALKSVHLPTTATTEANYRKMPPELLTWWSSATGTTPRGEHVCWDLPPVVFVGWSWYFGPFHTNPIKT